MIGRWPALGLACALFACEDTSLEIDPIELTPDDVRSGTTFLQPATHALQEDAFANPGLLWVDLGREAFHENNEVTSCAECHDADGRKLSEAAAHYPAIDEASGTLVNLESRINLCRERHQSRPALAYESQELLSLTTYVASLSNGVPHAPILNKQTQPYFETGSTYFHTRRGQFNISCAQCHDDNWGQRLRGDTLSQGHGNGFPTYRFEWQSIGSLHRRFRDCDAGVRAEPLPLGDATYIALELYLAVRANGLEIETPAVRR